MLSQSPSDLLYIQPAKCAISVRGFDRKHGWHGICACLHCVSVRMCAQGGALIARYAGHAWLNACSERDSTCAAQHSFGTRQYMRSSTPCSERGCAYVAQRLFKTRQHMRSSPLAHDAPCALIIQSTPRRCSSKARPCRRSASHRSPAASSNRHRQTHGRPRGTSRSCSRPRP